MGGVPAGAEEAQEELRSRGKIASGHDFSRAERPQTEDLCLAREVRQIQQFSHHPLVVKGRKRRAMIHFLSALRFALRKYRRAAGPALAAVLREE